MTSILKTNAIEPQSGTTLTIGQSGQNVVVNADSIKNNVLKDAGGNALFTSNGSGVLSGVNAGFCSAQVLISTTTVSSAVGSISFTSGLTSTYKEYVFEWTNIKPVTNNVNLQVGFSSNGGSSYGIEKTTTFVYVYNNNANNSSSFTYQTARDLANSTGAQQIASLQGNGASECSSGTLRLFNPASTTYVKNFYVVANSYDNSGPYYIYNIPAGYVNTTSALNAIQFTMSSGNIASGKMKMYGIK